MMFIIRNWAILWNALQTWLQQLPSDILYIHWSKVEYILQSIDLSQEEREWSTFGHLHMFLSDALTMSIHVSRKAYANWIPPQRSWIVKNDGEQYISLSLYVLYFSQEGRRIVAVLKTRLAWIYDAFASCFPYLSSLRLFVLMITIVFAFPHLYWRGLQIEHMVELKFRLMHFCSQTQNLDALFGWMTHHPICYTRLFTHTAEINSAHAG